MKFPCGATYLKKLSKCEMICFRISVLRDGAAVLTTMVE